MLIRRVLCWSIGEVTSNIAPTFRDTHCGLAYDVCDRLLGTGHYLSPGGGDRRILGGITWLLGERKGGSVVTESPKGGIAGNFGRIQKGNHSNFLIKLRHSGGGGRGCESYQKLLGGSPWWSNIQNRDRLNFTLFSPNSSPPSPAPPPPPAISNDRSLSAKGLAPNSLLQFLIFWTIAVQLMCVKAST